MSYHKLWIWFREYFVSWSNPVWHNLFNSFLFLGCKVIILWPLMKGLMQWMGPGMKTKPRTLGSCKQWVASLVKVGMNYLCAATKLIHVDDIVVSPSQWLRHTMELMSWCTAPPLPCITTAIWHCRKTFSQWEHSFHWKLCCHWLKDFDSMRLL